MLVFKSVFEQSLNRDYVQPYMHYMYENVFSNVGISREEVENLYESLASNDLARVILSVPAISAFNRDMGGIYNSTFDVSITSQLYFDLLGLNAKGIYSPYANGILVIKDLEDVLLHENVHQFNEIIFKNECNPYNTLKQAQYYYKAIFRTLEDINLRLEAGIKNTINYFSSNQDFAKAIIKSLNLECSSILPDPDILLQDNSIKNKELNNKLNDFSKNPFEPNIEDILNMNKEKISKETKQFIDSLLQKVGRIDVGFPQLQIVDSEEIQLIQHVEEDPAIENILIYEPTRIESSLKSQLDNLLKIPMFSPLLIDLDVDSPAINQNRVQLTQDTEKVIIDYDDFISKNTQELANIVEHEEMSNLISYASFGGWHFNNAYEQFLCVYEVYPNMRYDAETIAKFYQLSVYLDVKELFPHLCKYHSQVIVPEAEEYYLKNTNQCPVEKAFDLYEYS